VPSAALARWQNDRMPRLGHTDADCAAAVPATMRTTTQAQFAAGLALNTGNPTNENIRKDFERFSFLLDLDGAAPGNPQRLTHLGHLNYWRNHVAHQKATLPPAGVPRYPRS